MVSLVRLVVCGRRLVSSAKCSAINVVVVLPVANFGCLSRLVRKRGVRAVAFACCW